MMRILIFSITTITLSIFSHTHATTGVSSIENKTDIELLSSGQWQDNKAGLVWMRCALGQTWTGVDCIGKPSELKWEQIQSEINTKINNNGFAGHSDWRLPSINELKSTFLKKNAIFKRNIYLWSNTPLGSEEDSFRGLNGAVNYIINDSYQDAINPCYLNDCKASIRLVRNISKSQTNSSVDSSTYLAEEEHKRKKEHEERLQQEEKQRQIEIEQARHEQQLAQERQRAEEERERSRQQRRKQQEKQARRQEQWQQLGQVLGAAATVYTAKQTQKANTARYSKPTPTPTYTPSQTSVYTPPAPITQINTPSYNPTPTINYPNSSTKNKVNSSEYEVHNCLSINNNHLQNNCNFPVWVSQCAYKPSYDKKVQLNAFEMGSSFDCEKNIGLDSIAARSKDPARLTGQKIVWFACKKPATPKNTIFDSSRQLITGYCE